MTPKENADITWKALQHRKAIKAKGKKEADDRRCLVIAKNFRRKYAQYYSHGLVK